MTALSSEQVSVMIASAFTLAETYASQGRPACALGTLNAVRQYAQTSGTNFPQLRASDIMKEAYQNGIPQAIVQAKKALARSRAHPQLVLSRAHDTIIGYAAQINLDPAEALRELERCLAS